MNIAKSVSSVAADFRDAAKLFMRGTLRTKGAMALDYLAFGVVAVGITALILSALPPAGAVLAYVMYATSLIAIATTVTNHLAESYRELQTERPDSRKWQSLQLKFRPAPNGTL